MAAHVPHGQEITRHAGAFAHEINNLIESLLGNVAILENDLGSGHPGATALSTIKEAAVKVGRIAEELDAIERGADPRQERINLNPIVCRTLILEEQELAPNVRIVRKVDPDLCDISADRAQISQLIREVARLALFTIPRKGRVVLTTRSLHVDEELGAEGLNLPTGQYVYLTVEANVWRDPEDEIADGATSRGAGAHEAALKDIEELSSKARVHFSIHANDEWVTAYHLYFPALTATKTTPATPVAAETKGSETILVVDDDQMVVDVTKIVLTRLGYQVLISRNGKEALDTVNAHDGPIDLALLDLVMPVMGGAEAFPLLKRARPEMKIIICTGFAKGSASEVLQNAGVSEFLLKPFGPETLTKAIRRALDSATTAEAT